jgi:hypothetical protein
MWLYFLYRGKLPILGEPVNVQLHNLAILSLVAGEMQDEQTMDTVMEALPVIERQMANLEPTENFENFPKIGTIEALYSYSEDTAGPVLGFITDNYFKKRSDELTGWIERYRSSLPESCVKSIEMILAEKASREQGRRSSEEMENMGTEAHQAIA